MSLPVPAVSESFPSPPISKLSRVLPVMVSDSSLPVTFSSPVAESSVSSRAPLLTVWGVAVVLLMS